MVYGVPILECKEEYNSNDRDLKENQDAIPKGGMYFNYEKI